MDHSDRTKLKPRQFRLVSRPRVRVVAGPDEGAVLSPEDRSTIAIGTSPDNDLSLTDPTVSRYHLEIRQTAGGLEVCDLGSSNGTYVAAVRIERAKVLADTRLQIGATTVAVEDAGTAVAPPLEDDELAPGLIGRSEAIRDISRAVVRLASVRSSVLIQGETGVGKEVVARAVHDTGERRDGPFVVVDCGSMPPTLVASQLFGHERGAFTGATERRAGAFERAAGGTVLLDEIGELPLDIQPSLLGVLERQTFTRVGGAAECRADVRVLAATNRDLRAEVNRGAFRADLYYRLAVARIVIPPLRERTEDIEPLVAHFAERITGVPGDRPLAESLPALETHRWTGNVRELRNVVEAALVMGELNLERGGDGGVAVGGVAPPGEAVVPYREARSAALARFERDYLAALIEQCEGNASEAARRAKMDRPYLLTLLRKHGLR